jgi:hypothetical protein
VPSRPRPSASFRIYPAKSKSKAYVRVLYFDTVARMRAYIAPWHPHAVAVFQADEGSPRPARDRIGTIICCRDSLHGHGYFPHEIFHAVIEWAWLKGISELRVTTDSKDRSVFKGEESLAYAIGAMCVQFVKRCRDLDLPIVL